MKESCSNCAKKCKFNNRSILVDTCCETAKKFENICINCGYEKTCNKDYKGWCANNRNYEISKMSVRTNEKIIEYLEYLPSVNCPNESIDLMELATALAEENWYDNCHSSEDWNCFAKEVGIKKSEEDFIKQDYAPRFITEAKSIIDKKESKKTSLNIFNINDKSKECLNCPPEFKNRCIMEYLPDNWIGFPDLYFKEAFKRGILNSIRESR